MAPGRVIKKFCKLENSEVKLLGEKIYELGREDVLEKDYKCLDRNNSCEELNCKYAPRGIGDVGGKNPF